MHAPTPLAVVATSDAVLSGQAGGSGEQLTTALRTQIDASAVAVGPRTIPIEIADGAAKLALVTLDSDAGATKVETTIDLTSLVVDSAWLAEPKAPDVTQADKPRGGALPPSASCTRARWPTRGRWNCASRPSRWSASSPSASWSSTPTSSSACAMPMRNGRAATTNAAVRSKSDQGSIAPAAAAAGSPVPAGPLAPTRRPQPSAHHTTPGRIRRRRRAPAIPPSSASAPGVARAARSRREAQAVAPGAVDPPPGCRSPGRRRGVTDLGRRRRQRSRPQRQLQVRDQVMRNLNNAN